MFALAHFFVKSFNVKTQEVLQDFKDPGLFMLKCGDASGIATQNHAESFNKLMLDVRQLNPVLQLKSLVKRSCRRWNNEFEKAQNCTSILPPGLTAKATYKEQTRLAASSTYTIEAMGKVRKISCVHVLCVPSSNSSVLS